MKQRALVLGATAVLLLSVAVLSYVVWRLPADTAANTAEVTRGPLEIWSSYPGEIQSERMTLIATAVGGGATLIALAPEGAAVKRGDVLARFDDTLLQQQTVKLTEEQVLAQAELEGLEFATLPIERGKLEAEAAAARHAYERERRFLDETASLQQDGLMSAEEVAALRDGAEELQHKADNLARELDLTVRYLHPARLRHMRAKVEAATQALALARAQLEATIVYASSDGVVLYRMLQLGTEFRAARVGDVLAPNQPFMMLPDLARLVVQCNVPESELARARVGNTAVVRPLAYPSLALTGVVRRVGGVAQSVPGRPSWQRFFAVEIALHDSVPELRPGMSVTADVLAYHNTDAVLIPRVAVRWEAGRPVGEFATLLSTRTRGLTLGYADARYYEVLAGAQPGDRVYLP